jgi:peptidoglycan hydrolase-like protein with peptidoglycan-binding domain
LSGSGYLWTQTEPNDAPVGAAVSPARLARTLSRHSTTTAPATTVAPPTTTVVPRMPDPAFALLPEVPDAGIGPGASGDVVLMFEQRMKDVQLDPGPVDGVFDEQTRYAVETVEKIAGLPRVGRIGPAERLYLMAFKFPKPRVGRQREAKRVEIDLDRQILTVYHHHLVALVTTTSTGSGEHFCGGNDGCQWAVTPPGKFAFTWRYPGWRKGKLGRLYNPVYFNGGIAVHGYSSVPTEPASHGCARIPMHIAEYFPGLVERGDPIYVAGTPAEREAVTPSAPSPTTTPSTTASPTTAPPPTSTTSTVPPATTTTTVPPTTSTVPPSTVPSPTTTVAL